MLDATQTESQYLTASELIALHVITKLATDGYVTRECVLFDMQGLSGSVSEAIDTALADEIIQSDVAHIIGIEKHARRVESLSMEQMITLVDGYRASAAQANEKGLSLHELMVLAMFREQTPETQQRVLAALEADPPAPDAAAE